MMKINQTYILILDFVNYFLLIEKENLAELREQSRLRQVFSNLLKNHEIKATRSKRYRIHLLPNI